MADEREIVAIEIDRLFDFVDGLQTSGYRIDPRQIAALNHLLVTLIAHGESPGELPLKTMIAPLVCSTPLEQEDFYQRFDRWQATLLPIKQEDTKEDSSLTSPTGPKNKLPPAADFDATTQDSPYITREATKQGINYTKVLVKGYVQEILPVLQIKPIVSALRRRTQVPSTEVDMERTIENAIKRNNWLEVIYRQRQVLPEYVVLIDRKNRLDLQARFVQEVLAKLEADGVWLHQYEFKGDPRICFPLGKKNTPLRLKDLQVRHPDSRLLVFSGTNELTNPLTGNLQEWVESLEYWKERAILTPDKLGKSLLEGLEEQDFAILPMTFDGLASVVRVFEAEHVLLSFSASSLPLPLTERPTRWTGRNAPPEVEVKALISDLKTNYLGTNGFYWLCATAVYPELRWELTLHLGSVLKDDTEKPLLDTNTLICLARLPWFRFGYMPDWIRLPLVESFLPNQETQVREILSNLFSSTQDGLGFELAIAHAAEGSSQKQVLQDHVMIKFLMESDKKKLAVSVPSTLQNVFSQVQAEANQAEQYREDTQTLPLQRERALQDENVREAVKKLSNREGRPLRVFIAHTAENKSDAKYLYDYLHKLDLAPWLDSEKIKGRNWNKEILKALDEADILLLCLSKKSVIRGELSPALKSNLSHVLKGPKGSVAIIPVRLNNCDVPEALKEYLIVDLFAENGIETLLTGLNTRAQQIMTKLILLENLPAFDLKDRDHVLHEEGESLSSKVITNEENSDTLNFVENSNDIVQKNAGAEEEFASAQQSSKTVSSRAELLCNNGRRKGKRIDIPLQGLSIGRSEGNEVRLSDISVSRFHATITFFENSFHIEDNHSTFGTYVNNRRIKNKTMIKAGDQLRFGTNDSFVFLHYADKPINESKQKVEKFNNKQHLLKVFLCGASEDRLELRKLHKLLAKQGTDPWLDSEKILPGQDWNFEINKALDESDAILLCLSKNSVSREGYVTREIRIALDRALEMPEGRIFLVLARLEECELPYRISSYQWVDLFTTGGMNKLIKSLNLRANQVKAKPISLENLPSIVKQSAQKQKTKLKQSASTDPQIHIRSNVGNSNIFINPSVAFNAVKKSSVEKEFPPRGSWVAYENGNSIGSVSTEGSVVLRDEELETSARITLKRGGSYISVSCSIYGWMDHTRFFASVSEAQREYLLMKPTLKNMVENVLASGKSDLKMWEAIADFVRRFP